MEKKITYVANDGEEFEDEKECLAHERCLQVGAFGDHLRLWDEDMKPLDPAEENALDDAYFIYADTPEVREFVNEHFEGLFQEIGWSANFVGYINDNWYDLEELYNMVLKTIATMVG